MPEQKEWRLIKRWYDSVDHEYEVRTNGLDIRITKLELSSKKFTLIIEFNIEDIEDGIIRG